MFVRRTYMDLHAHTHAFCISFLLALKQNTKNLVAENDTYVLSYSLGGQKSEMGLMG